MRLLLLVMFALGVPGAAAADPCRGPLPPPLSEFSGPVQYVGDGDSLCVGRSADAATWIEVRLADFYAPELKTPEGRRAKAELERVTRGAVLRCRAGPRSYDRVVATCRIGARSVGALMRSRVAEGGRGKDGY